MFSNGAARVSGDQRTVSIDSTSAYRLGQEPRGKVRNSRRKTREIGAVFDVIEV